MFIKSLTLIGLIVSAGSLSSASDLGDVVSCPGQNPVARFSLLAKSPIEPKLSLQDVFLKMRDINREFSESLQAKVPILNQQIRYRAIELTNRDGDVLGACKLQQLYKINQALLGERFAVVNSDLFQKLSPTEKNVFLVEIYIQLSNDKLLVTPAAAIDIVNFQTALANKAPLTRRQWYSLLPKSWDTCLIPIEEFGTQLCMGDGFDPVTMTGATLSYLGQQTISVLNQRIMFSQLNMKNGLIEFLHWSDMKVRPALWINSSMVYPATIYFNQQQSIDSIITGELHFQNSIFCKTQKLLTYGGRYKFDLQSGCLVGPHSLNWQVLGEVLDRNGHWNSVRGQDVRLDSEGYLLN